jgi:hypothetical protein
LETRLCHLKFTRQSLSLHEESEVIAAVIRVMDFSDLDGVVGQEVVDDEGEFIETGVEAEDSAVVIQELLLALHSSTTEGLLHVLLQTGVSELLLGDLLLSKTVIRDSLWLTLCLSESLYKKYNNYFNCRESPSFITNW